MVMPTEETMQWLDKAHARCELFTPVFLPMVIKPRPWHGPFGGGYLSKHLRYPLVKTANKNYLEELRSWQMPKVYAALNALQDTAWAINQRVLDVMKQVWDGGGNLGGLPPSDVLPLPAKDFPESAESDDPRVVAWRKKAAEVYSENARLVSKRIAMNAKLGVAERLQFEELYFPHAMDWRGRCYPVVPVLNPQADDSAKALLRFSYGAPLGDNGAYWLGVHGANCFGVDKVAFEARVQWVNEHADQIIESADNPLDGSRWWAEADAPYQFLAFCFEWAALVRHHQAGLVMADFVSYLPVGLDGSCNGLQNFSAMLRDEVGGAATNLVPSEKPSDIYAEVAKVANHIAHSHVADENDGRATRDG
jgi:DNA-directed RNA polymerase